MRLTPILPHRAVLLFLTAQAFAAACAPATARHNPTSATPYGRAILVADNREPVAVALQIMNSASRLTLGTVPGTSCGTFAVPDGFLGNGSDLRLLAEPLGAEYAFVSDAFDIPPGQWTKWTLQRLQFATILLRWQPAASRGADDGAMAASLVSWAQCGRGDVAGGTQGN